ncbi:MAG: DUF362 domain-containing protein [Lentisphaerae bacterium]|nr:DUF362 domain-containing protein [Lentisphaerota bacterium]
MVKVHYARAESYTQRVLDEALKKSVSPVLSEVGGAAGKRIMIKPNLLEYRKENDPASIHPQLLTALCRMLKEHGAAEVAVIENPAVRSADMIIRAMNIMPELESMGVKVANCSKYTKFPMPAASCYHQLEVSGEFREYDLIIDLAKAKTHAMMTFTGGVKNLFGLVRGSERLSWHLAVGRNFDNFADMLLDIYLLTSPQITVMDAVIGMEGNGPGSGDAVELNFICASADALALDASVSGRLGITDTPVLRQAEKRMLLPEFVNCGEVPEIRTIKLPEPPEKKLEWGVYFPVKMRKFLRGMLLSKPVVNRKKCISCGLCAQKCPPQTLKMRKGAPKFDYLGCIRCYCCQEFCPNGAITVEKSFTLKILSGAETIIRKLNIYRPSKCK